MSYYRNGRQRTKQIRRRISFLLLIVIVIIAALSLFVVLKQRPTSIKTPTKQAVATKTTYSGTVSGSYLYSGTIVLARAVETYANGNYDQPFSALNTLGSFDARIGVLECPFTNNYDSYQNEVDNLVFNCKPAWIPYLKKYYPILNLSSDHMNDQGPQGIASTFKLLNAAGFQTVGTYDPASLADDCKPVLLTAHYIYGSTDKQVQIPVAMCSYNYKFLFQPTQSELQSITTWSKLMPVVAMLNHGPEYQQTASAQSVAIAHTMIDDGADYVIGNGTHWVQNTEVYKGKLIVYSMGNFIFDQLDYNGRIALNVGVALKTPYTQNLASWISHATACQQSGDGCLKLAKQYDLGSYKLNYTFSAVGSYGGDKQVATKANAQQQADIERIANWQASMKLLGQQ